MQVKPLDTVLLKNIYDDVMELMSNTTFSDAESKYAFIQSDAVKALLAFTYKDTRAYGKVFYPDRFSLPFSPLHDEAFAYIDAKDADGNPKYKKLILKAFRGFGKSSIAKTLLAKSIRFNDTMFATYIGKNEGFAIMQTEATKNSMLTNKLENYFFGSIKTKYISDIDTSFSKKMWATSLGTLVLPRGAGQPVRGLLHDWEGKSYRPSRFFIDDLEDKKLIDNDATRQEIYEWVLSDVAEAKPLPGVSMDYQFVYIDTLKHSDAVLQKLADRPDWDLVDLPLCDANYKSYAPAFYPNAEIQKEVAHHRSAGTMDLFYQEKMGKAISSEDAAFRKEYFRYYDESDNIEKNGLNYTGFEKIKHQLETVVIVDPAKTVKVHSADSGFAVVSFHTEKNIIFIRYAEGIKLYPEEIYAKAFELAKLYGANVIGYEETSLNEFIRKPFVDAMLSSGNVYQLEPLQARSAVGEFSGAHGGKKGRIASMIPYYRKGQVYHNVAGCGMLESQLLDFPKSKLWDVMDATAYFVELLDKGGRYWQQPEEEYPDADSIENEYKDLEREDNEAYELDNWRVA